MKARILALALLAGALLAAPVAAFDFGLDVLNVSSFSYESEWSFSQTDRATLWLSLPVSPSSSIYASGLYEFTASFGPGGYTMVPWRLDLGRTEWEGLSTGAFGPATSFRWSVGRIPLQDFSGRVVSSLADGFLVEGSKGNFSARLAGAYAGLLSKNDARILIDADDAVRWADQDQYFAPSRALAGMGLRFVEPVEGMDLGFDAWAQFDLGPDGLPTHTQYFEPYLDGRLGRGFRWRAWYILETGQDPDFFSSMAAGGRGRWSWPELGGLRLTGSLFWASASSGELRQFSPLSTSLVGGVAPMTFADVTVLSADMAVSPSDWMDLGFNLSVFGRGDLGATDPFTGIEAALDLVMAPVSDFNVNLSGGLYAPFVAGLPLRWLGTLTATLEL